MKTTGKVRAKAAPRYDTCADMCVAKYEAQQVGEKINDTQKDIGKKKKVRNKRLGE